MHPQPLHAIHEPPAAPLAAASGTTDRMRPPRTPLLLAWAIALLVHVLALLLLDGALQRDRSPAPRDAIDIVLLPPEPAAPPVPAAPVPATRAAPAPPELPVPSSMAPPPPALPELPAAAPATAPRPGVTPVPAPRTPVVLAPAAPRDASPAIDAAAARLGAQRITLYAPDGRVRIPSEVFDSGPAPVASYVAVPQQTAPWEGRRHAVDYQATLLEPFWAPDGETLLNEFMRRSTVTKSFRTPWGTEVKCAWVLIVGGCAW